MNELLRVVFVDYPHVFFMIGVIVFASVCAGKTKSNPSADAVLLALYVATLYGAISMFVESASRKNVDLGASGWSQPVAFIMLLGHALPAMFEIGLRMWRGVQQKATPHPPSPSSTADPVAPSSSTEGRT